MLSTRFDNISLISMPVFYVAVKRWLNDDLGGFVATTWFAFFPIFITILITFWNTSYLNLFLAIYTLILLRYPKGSRLVLLYAAIGLCMQCHFTCATLIPASIVFLHSNRTNLWTDLAWHLGGVVIIALLHVPPILYYLETPAPLIDSLAEIKHGALKFDWGSLVPGVFFPLLLVYLIVILVAFLQRRPKSTWVYIPRGKGRVLWVIFVVFGMIVGVQAKFSKSLAHHFYPLVPFVCLYTGFLAKRFVLHARPVMKFTSAIIILVITIFVIRSFVLGTPDYIGQGLSYNKWLADQVFLWMRQSNWKGSTRILHAVLVRNKEGALPYQKIYGSDDCIDTMIRFRHGDEFAQREQGDQLAVISIAQATPLFGDPKSWVETVVPNVTSSNCEVLSDYGDISSLICPVSSGR